VTCPQCAFDNPPAMAFCGRCGAKLASQCPACGFANPEGFAFCGKCGARVAEAPAPPRQPSAAFASPQSYTPKHLAEKILTSKGALEGERKQVTVLFADLKGSMELLADRDPEEARKLLDPVLERMMEAVHRYEGTVNQVMGDGIMALFGAPLAHEDHAARACYAALRMQESVKKYAEEMRRSHAAVVKIRVGLNSGEVVVRAIGSDLHMDYTAVGQTTHLAARMEQLADPGAIVITPETLALGEGYVEVKSLGLVSVKGLADPVEVYEVTGAGPARTRLQAGARRGLTRFVGRDAELAQIRRAQELVDAGHGQVAAIVGEPGVGKSRLVYEFARSQRMRGWLVLEAASVSYGKATSYAPVIDLLKSYFKIQDRDELREIREKVTGKLLTVDRVLEPALPALLALLDVPVEDDSWGALDAGQRRQRTLDGIRRLLLREARERPLLLIFEDLHWIDGETQALLDSLAENLGSARLLLLVNYRPEYQHGWSGKTYYSQTRLDALRAETAGELLDGLLGDDPALATLRQLLVRRGNPFFLEETVRTLVETGVLAGERGRYRLTRPINAIQVPATVQVVLAARIDRLSPEDKRLLQTASVIGKDVPFALLQAIADAPEALRSGLDRLQAAEFVYETGLYPDLEYSFKHALTHEVTYGGLLHERRRELHLRIVGAIETLRRDRLAGEIERLAHHALQAEAWEKCVEYARQAGGRAMERSAYAQAGAYFDQALDAVGHLPESRATLELALELRSSRTAPHSALGEHDRQLQVSEEALRTAERLGDQPRVARITSALGNALWQLGLNVRALEVAERSMVAAEAVGDALVLASARLDVAMICRSLGDYRRAIDTVTPAVELLTGARIHERIGRAVYPAVTTRSTLIGTLTDLGEFDRAMTIARENIEIAKVLGQPVSLLLAQFNVSAVLLQRGEFGTAVTLLEPALVLCTSAALASWYPQIAGALGHAYARTGRLGESLSLLDGARERALAVARRAEALVGIYLADAYLQAGRINEAEQEAARVLALTRERSERGAEAGVLHVLAEAAIRSEAPHEAVAEEHYRQALALATDLGMRPLVAHCHLGLGKLYRRTGKREEARDHLTTATSMYREMDMRFWLEKAEAETRALA
jgi:class 3 adenylate cyclase/tetratricopeptide (TPR) repeat protein